MTDDPLKRIEDLVRQGKAIILRAPINASEIFRFSLSSVNKRDLLAVHSSIRPGCEDKITIEDDQVFYSRKEGSYTIDLFNETDDCVDIQVTGAYKAVNEFYFQLEEQQIRSQLATAEQVVTKGVLA